MFANFNANRLVRADSAERRGLTGLVKDIEAEKDSQFEEKTTGEFGDNQFWNAPASDEFDLDALMADM